MRSGLFFECPKCQFIFYSSFSLRTEILHKQKHFSQKVIFTFCLGYFSLKCKIKNIFEATLPLRCGSAAEHHTAEQKASHKEQSIVEHTLRLPSDIKSLRSCSVNWVKMLLIRHLGIKRNSQYMKIIRLF